MIRWPRRHSSASGCTWLRVAVGGAGNGVNPGTPDGFALCSFLSLAVLVYLWFYAFRHLSEMMA